jgi:methyltransferase-like protein
MKIKKGFVIREVGGENVVVPVGALSKTFHGMINLNETGAFIWERLSNGQSQEEIVKALCEEYEVEEGAAMASVQCFCEKLRAEGMLIDE